MESSRINRRTHDRLHGLRGFCAVGMATGLAFLLVSKFRFFPLPTWSVFSTVLGLIVLGNVICWAWADRWLVWHLGGWRRWAWRIVHGMFFALILGLLGTVLTLGREFFDALPIVLIMWVLSWNLTVFTLAVLLTGLDLARLMIRLFSFIIQSKRLNAGIPRGAGCPLNNCDKSDSCSSEAGPPAKMSRRALLARSAMLTPVLLSGGFVGGGLYQADRFVVRRISLKLPRLPDRLRGLTITHLSDLHVGRLFRPEHLPAVVETSNRLGSDLVTITGDILDHSNDFLPEATKAIAQLEHRFGRYLVVGNHDLIDDPHIMLGYLSAREPNLLCDRTRTIDIGGERLRVAGLFWSRYEHPRGDDPGHIGRVQATFGRPADHDEFSRDLGSDAGEQPFTLALTHHPHAFDALADHGVDLTLAGHTHGGQLMLTPPDWSERVGAGNLLFRYIWGEYHRGASTLYVNSGVGNWFPLRINAPAEIVQIRLI